MKIARRNRGPRVALLIALSGQTALAAESTTEIVRGPFYSGTIRGKAPDAAIAMKGIAVTVGREKRAYVCYDADLLRVSLAWTGDFLEFGNTQLRIEWPPPPQVKGIPAFGTKPGPGWARAGSFADPRPHQQGPLPKDWAHYNGLFVNGDNVVLDYAVGDCQVYEMPGLETGSTGTAFSRTFRLIRSSSPMSLLVAESENATGGVGAIGPTAGDSKNGAADRNVAVLVNTNGTTNSVIAVGLVGAPAGATWQIANGRIQLNLPAIRKATSFKLVLWSGPQSDLAKLGEYLDPKGKTADLAALCKGGPAHWSEPVVTKGTIGASEEPYVVDILTEPFPNTWNIRTFFGGFDFFPDGRAAVCTFHGDVWLVSGIDDGLQKLTWKRYAAGLFQPLGLKIVDNKIYVLGRDQITRLHDLNNDGEADHYENFNNDTVVTSNYHEFSLDLHTDSEGSFYFAKGAPWEPEVTSPHQGTVLKVSKDGSRMEVFATGFRAPNGSAIGPHDEITVSDNQGHWIPSSKLDLVKKDGFYGMTPAAQRELTLRRAGTNFVANPSNPQARAAFKFKGWEGVSPMPEGYDQPLCWLPTSMDNSSGGQVWVTSDKWGPFKGHLLFMSYGKCTLFHVMMEEIDGVTQAGMAQFPLKFQTGIMRARFNPRDGQLYLCGLRGWQTSGVKDGGFYRVRYTGKPVHMPYGVHAAKNGVQITFTSPLDPKSAASVDNYSVEEWNYQWSGNYGSPEFSVNNPDEKRHDQIEVKAVELSADKKTVFLELPEIKPCDQMKIKFSIDAADGTLISQEIYNTIHRLGREIKQVP